MANHKKYPFSDMNIGDSVVISSTTPNTVRSSVQQFVRSNPGYRFSVKKCFGGTLLTRVEAVVADEGPTYSTYVCSVDRTVIYYGPADHAQATAALATMRAKGVELVDPVIVRAPTGSFPAGYLNEWIG